MLQTFRLNNMKNIFIALVFVLPIATASATNGIPSGATTANGVQMTSEGIAYSPTLPNEVRVSDRDFNQFVFPSPVVKGPIFPADSPLLGKPVYLANNTQVLLQFEPGADTPFDMIVECQNGQVYKLYLLPRPINGITYYVAGSNTEVGSDVKFADNEPSASAPRAQEVELMKSIVMGEVPAGFDPINLPPLTRFDKFSVVPLSGWSNGALRVMSFSLVAVPGKTAVVAPPQFYRAGITAVLLSGNVVDATHSPTLYVVEKLNENE